LLKDPDCDIIAGIENWLSQAKDMTIPGLDRISNLLKQEPRRITERRHLMLAGIDQNLFLNQWGKPEIQIALDLLEGFYKKDSVAVSTDTPGEPLHSVWIYKNRNRIFFFTRKKLVSHFKWSDFREKRGLPLQGMEGRPSTKAPSFMSTTLSLVA